MIDLGLAGPQRPEYYQPPEPTTDPVEAFLKHLAGFGLDPGAIDPSGKLVRFDIDKTGDDAGWYVFHLGDISAGAFGNWKTGLKENWCSKQRHELTDEESAKYKAMVAEARRYRQEQERQNQEAAKIRAAGIWAEAEPASPDHPYLLKKGVPAHGLKQSRGKLVVPIMDETGTLWNLQFIGADGVKKFLKFGRVEGCSFTIPGDGRLFIGEGVSTMASVHAATGGTAICAFNAGNVPKVAQVVRQKCPTDQIIIAADNDRFSVPNAGLKYGEEAARLAGGVLVFPNFDGLPGGDDPDQKLTDFNDLAKIAGLEAVEMQIKTPAGRKSLPPQRLDDMRFSGRLKARPAPLEFLFRFNDQGFLPSGVVGVLTADGGTGKTFFLISLALAGARGSNFGPINAPRPINTLILPAEDSQDELDRRAWDTAKGEFPNNLYGLSVYGEIGPLMRLEGSSPVLADGYYWLEETLSLCCPGLDLLILDPKSRFYGLDENNNDHATQWIQCLESLSKRYRLTILFSHHTSKDRGSRISQAMSRGASAIVDGCRWQAGMVRMDAETANRYGIEDPRNYVLFDAPKSNYGADLPGQIIFRRGENGVLEWADPEAAHLQAMSEALLERLKLDPEKYTKRELIRDKRCVGIANEMIEAFPEFRRRVDMERAINWLLRNNHLKIEMVNPGRNAKAVLMVQSHV